MQLGEGHCFICHKTYNQTHICLPEITNTTPCNSLTCGIWYEHRNNIEYCQCDWGIYKHLKAKLSFRETTLSKCIDCKKPFVYNK